MSAVKEPPSLPQPQQQPHVFLQTLNPMRGKMEWKPQPLDYDYKQEVARAAFADMLHDTERVSLYTFTIRLFFCALRHDLLVSEMPRKLIFFFEFIS